MSMKQTIHDAMKDAMRAKDKDRLSAIRLMQAEFKRIEVDERIEIDDTRILAIAGQDGQTAPRLDQAVRSCRPPGVGRR